MTAFSFSVLAFALGVVAGLRAITAPMVVSWGACFHWIDVRGTWASFLGHKATALIVTLLAIGELVSDQLPSTPSRKAPPSFAIRLLSGAFSAAALATGIPQPVLLGVLCGCAGTIAGTLGGYEGRTRLVRRLKVPDFVIAVPEDLLAVGGGFLLVSLVPH